MIKRMTWMLASILLFAACSEDVCRWADPLVGTADNGHTFPGACVPFGLVQPSPDSGNSAWEYCSGFNIADTTLIGFSQTHLNGTGCSDLGDVLLLPFVEETPLRDNPYVKESLTSTPGYASVQFRNGVSVEMTATEHVSHYLMKYPDPKARKLYVDLQNGMVNGPGNLLFHVLEADIDYESPTTISGRLVTENWTRREWYFVLVFSEPYVNRTNLELTELEKADKMILTFAEGNKPLGVKVAMSSVSTEGARKSMQAEDTACDFGKIRKQAHRSWHSLLSRVKVKGTD